MCEDAVADLKKDTSLAYTSSVSSASYLGFTEQSRNTGNILNLKDRVPPGGMFVSLEYEKMFAKLFWQGILQRADNGG